MSIEDLKTRLTEAEAWIRHLVSHTNAPPLPPPANNSAVFDQGALGRAAFKAGRSRDESRDRDWCAGYDAAAEAGVHA